MKLHKIETAPISNDHEKHHILLYWEKSNHYEDGWIYKDIESSIEFGKIVLYHVLFDGEWLNEQPTHWSIFPLKYDINNGE